LRPVRFAALSILFLCFATFGATISRAQDQQEQSVAEAARQERARKQELQKRAKHVYTEEDLKHPRILTPEDRAQVEAKRNECAQKNNCSPSPAQNPPASLDANSQTNGKSLGEVARQLRKQKELQALKPKQTEPFHLPFETPALASPILPERPAIHPPAQPVVRSKTSSPTMPSNVFRRDPFSPVPARPGLRRLIAPAVPKIPKRTATPRIPIQPLQPPAPPEPAQPAAPVATVRPVRPQRAPSSVSTAAQKTVSVKGGDSLWKLAQQNLGRGKRWPELLAANPNIVDPNQIRAGAELNLPAADAASASARNASNNAASRIKVRKGDTLWTLAKSNLGRSSAWPCLAAANPSISDPNRIYENQELIVPAACTP
jgi:nucleoid-associated protein YgaU